MPGEYKIERMEVLRVPFGAISSFVGVSSTLGMELFKAKWADFYSKYPGIKYLSIDNNKQIWYGDGNSLRSLKYDLERYNPFDEEITIP